MHPRDNMMKGSLSALFKDSNIKVMYLLDSLSCSGINLSPLGFCFVTVRDSLLLYGVYE